MDAGKFFDAVEADLLLSGVDVLLDSVIVQDSRGFQTEFPVAVVIESDWATLRGLALGLLVPNPLHLITRICGYFSVTANWNKSKLGELWDRRKGNYH